MGKVDGLVSPVFLIRHHLALVERVYDFKQDVGESAR